MVWSGMTLLFSAITFALHSGICTKSWKKTCGGFVFFSIRRWARERSFSWERGRKGLSGFTTSWAQLMPDFCLTMASLCFPSKLLDIVLFQGQQKMPHILGEDRFSHSSSGGRSCLLNNARNSNQKLQKNFSVVLFFLFSFFFFYCCFQAVSHWLEMAQLYSVDS